MRSPGIPKLKVRCPRPAVATISAGQDAARESPTRTRSVAGGSAALSRARRFDAEAPVGGVGWTTWDVPLGAKVRLTAHGLVGANGVGERSRTSCKTRLPS